MNTRSIFEKMVYLPCYPAMNEAALEQMVRALQAGYATNATGAIANSLPLA
jgi:dTDP-4-amino-4,6-dideoxygalactose transaminase